MQSLGNKGHISDPIWDSKQSYIIEIVDKSDIQLNEVVGRGTFGAVWKSVWRGDTIAVKQIDKVETTDYNNELAQLSRINHPNIVRLYGTARCNDYLWLIMEYAECGNLFNLLHGDEYWVPYTMSQALSWVYQCARGVAYLHSMQPKPVVHRNLKSPNLLLFNGNTELKICNFGTACEVSQYMENCIGTARWMAPEVFRGTTYNEKCDVYSWGIILWEVLARRLPYDRLERMETILWAVHRNKRPFLLQGCPPVIENLMTICWSPELALRPSMDDVVKILFRSMTNSNFDLLHLPLRPISDFNLDAKQSPGAAHSTQLKHPEDSTSSFSKVMKRDTTEVRALVLFSNKTILTKRTGTYQSLFITDCGHKRYGTPQTMQNIQPSDVQLIQAVGSGAYGVVYRGVWNGNTVAVKQVATIHTKHYDAELAQLSQLIHPNIVRLLATARDNISQWLIMEFAECGSLHHELYASEIPVPYTIIQALSWLYQCARGISYMHFMLPNPVVHRDLKPQNLLLFNDKSLLKICDLGTARYVASTMSNNTGSARWMAPEVFRDNQYNEKCDVYSFGVIVWELMARQLPFTLLDSIYAILWAVNSGERPPRFANCPHNIDNLMTRCWDKDPTVRPSMDTVVGEIENIFDDFYDMYHAPITPPDSGSLAPVPGLSPLPAPANGPTSVPIGAPFISESTWYSTKNVRPNARSNSRSLSTSYSSKTRVRSSSTTRPNSTSSSSCRSNSSSSYRSNSTSYSRSDSRSQSQCGSTYKVISCLSTNISSVMTTSYSSK
ncbi:unnamed protein product [Oppiella nova]|uniref:Protein kinase domain-containing protein n=1 Tax=Oppiella nova TaxID=334625 RepID=A0A7R9LQS5_9ACAR|nr:unnamed protein product [Oppiella nova]CAG2166060.1 unnamed protein product [Oppiella nova]